MLIKAYQNSNLYLQTDIVFTVIKVFFSLKEVYYIKSNEPETQKLKSNHDPHLITNITLDPKAKLKIHMLSNEHNTLHINCLID